MIDSDAIIMSQLRSASMRYSDWAWLSLSGTPTIHIAVMNQPFLSYVFEGQKTVESRFSLHRVAPFEKVRSGDIVLMKAGPVVGSFTVEWVKYLNLEEYPVTEVVAEFGAAICADEAFWGQKRDARYATLLGITDVRKLTPVIITKTDRRAWVAL